MLSLKSTWGSTYEHHLIGMLSWQSQLIFFTGGASTSLVHSHSVASLGVIAEKVLRLRSSKLSENGR
jgi:hypothetical protein